MLNAAALGSELRERGLPAVEKILNESCQLGFLVGGDGQCAEESVHNHAGISYTLGRVLTLVVAQVEAELGRQAMPPMLRAPGLAGESRADGAAAHKSQAGGMRWCFSGEDRIVHPNGAVKGRRVEAAWRRGGGSRINGVRPRLPGACGVKRARLLRGTAREEALDASHEDVERGAGVALAKVSRRKASHEAESAHGLVTEAKT